MKAPIPSTKRGGGTTTMWGTSQAAAHVGGGGALYLSTHTTDSPAEVEPALKSAAKSLLTTNRGSILREYVGGF